LPSVVSVPGRAAGFECDERPAGQTDNERRHGPAGQTLTQHSERQQHRQQRFAGQQQAATRRARVGQAQVAGQERQSRHENADPPLPQCAASV